MPQTGAAQAIPGDPARLSEDEATQLALDEAEDRELARAVPAGHDDGRRLRRRDAHVDDQGLVGRSRARSPRQSCRTRRARSPRRGRALRSPGRWRAGARGRSAARRSSKPYVWLAFCLVFLLGLADLRRPLSVRNLDLLVLLGFTVSLAFFDRGEIFRSVPAVYPVLAYLLARGLWVGFGRTAGGAVVRLAHVGARRGRRSSSSASASGSTSRRPEG